MWCCGCCVGLSCWRLGFDPLLRKHSLIFFPLFSLNFAFCNVTRVPISPIAFHLKFYYYYTVLIKAFVIFGEKWCYKSSALSCVSYSFILFLCCLFSFIWSILTKQQKMHIATYHQHPYMYSNHLVKLQCQHNNIHKGVIVIDNHWHGTSVTMYILFSNFSTCSPNHIRIHVKIFWAWLTIKAIRWFWFLLANKDVLSLWRP